ncbi:MAG: hypothetical protein JWP63_624 [Candidatus Solibacter sp.]|jgi:hypothetical protein|nr:hypothetical protein [Candidatus Solibacter sp.]
MMGYSQQKASEYVSASEAIPRGKAPKIQVIFYQGGEAFSGLLEFAEKYEVRSAHFTAIGALNGRRWSGSIPSAK